MQKYIWIDLVHICICLNMPLIIHLVQVLLVICEKSVKCKNLTETSVEISKTQEGLYIFNLLRFRPILNDLYFIGCHGESTRREDITWIFNCLDMEEALIGAGV